MRFDPPQAAGPWQRRATLPPGTALAVDARHIDQIRCDRGTLWLTRAGDPADLILEAGQTLQFAAARGELLVTNLHRDETVGLTLRARPDAAPGRGPTTPRRGAARLARLVAALRGLTRALDFGGMRGRGDSWLAP